MEWMNEPVVVTVGLGLAVLRIYLETVGFDFARLPVTAKMMPKEQAQKFHRMGFYFSLGYFIMFAPGMLLS